MRRGEGANRAAGAGIRRTGVACSVMALALGFSGVLVVSEAAVGWATSPVPSVPLPGMSLPGVPSLPSLPPLPPLPSGVAVPPVTVRPTVGRPRTTAPAPHTHSAPAVPTATAPHKPRPRPTVSAPEPAHPPPREDGPLRPPHHEPYPTARDTGPSRRPPHRVLRPMGGGTGRGPSLVPDTGTGAVSAAPQPVPAAPAVGDRGQAEPVDEPARRVLKVLPLGAGIELVGLGLGFLGLRMRRR